MGSFCQISGARLAACRAVRQIGRIGKNGFVLPLFVSKPCGPAALRVSQTSHRPPVLDARRAYNVALLRVLAALDAERVGLDPVRLAGARLFAKKPRLFAALSRQTQQLRCAPRLRKKLRAGWKFF